MPLTHFPRIALSITDIEKNNQIKPLGIDLLELRVDLFKSYDPSYVTHQILARKKLKVPLLLTFRNQKKEGAKREISTQIKQDVFEHCIPFVNYVDIELSSPLLKKTISFARQYGRGVVVSSHNFECTPAHIETILKKALSARADIVKIAALAKSWDDVLRMVEFTHKFSKEHNLITMSLGKIGALSRIVLPAAGSLYTYTFLNKPTAPGQVNVKILKEHLKFYYRS